MRKLSAVLWCVFGFFAVMLAASCNVGLGESVDTSAPTLEITYPPIGATIRDKFILYGTCSDDKGVTAVTVAVVNTESKQTVDNLRATVNSNGTWQAELNESDSETGFYKYKDGSYQVSVTAFDDAGHSSGESSRTFDIDNTAPFFVISKPGVVKSENLKASAYGSLFTIEGTIADDHTIALMDVAIYDESGNIVSHEKYNSSDIDFFREEEIATAGGTSVTIAQYAQDLKTVANTRYSNVYGSDSGAGTKNYYASITLTDSAEVYQNPTGSERSALDLESDLVGNVTSNVYLYDDVYTSLMSAKKGLGLSAADLKNIINGTYTGKKDDSDAALSLLYSHVKNTTSNEDNRLYFSLNPQANPNYQVNGFAFSFDASGTVQQASSGNSITVTISAGLDGTNIAPECVKVWCKAYDEQPTDKDAVVGEINSLWKKVSQMELSDEDFSEVSSIEGTGGTAIDGWGLLYDYSKNNDKGSSVSTETFSVVLPEGISMEKYYIIAVTGADVDDVEFLQSEKVYGFAGNEMGVPPTVAITSPDNLAILASSAFEFAGTATINSQSLFVKELKATLTVTDESTSNVVATATDTITCTVDSDNKKIWTTSEQGALYWDSDNSVWKFDPTKLSNYETLKAETEEGKMYLYTLSVTGKSSSGHEANIERSVHIDTKLPSISISSAEPRVTKYEGLKDSSGSDISEKYIYLNGTVTIKGSIDEQNLKEVTYDLLCSTDLSKELTEADSVFKLAESNPNVQAVLEAAGMDRSLGKVFSINQTFDTTKITQLFEAITGKTDPMIKVEVVLMAEDSAIKNLGSENPVGNKVTYYASKDPILNGKTDTTAGKAFVICQETDRPQMTFSNVDPAITSKDDVGIKTVDGKEVNKNLFGTTSDNKIQIPIEDDDSITSVEVTLFDENGTKLADSNTYYGINPYSINVGKSTYTLNYQLPSTEGKYQIQIDAYDILKTDLTSESSVHKKSSGKFFVAVDSGAPNIKVLTPSEGSYQSGTVSVSGTVSKKEGVTISGKITKGNTEVSGATVNEVTISDSQNSDGLYTWSGTVEMPSDSSDSYKLTYTATDGYGQTTSESRGFVVDITAPTFAITTPSESEVYTADSMYTVKGTISDGSSTSGIKGLYWTLTEPTESSNGTYSPLSNGNLNSGWNQIAATPTETAGEYTWIANIELPTSSADGTVAKTVYISVVDEAGNVSSVSGNAASSSLKITLDKTAPSTTLLGTGLKKPAGASESGSKDLAGNLILDADSELDESITYYATDKTSGYKISGVVTEASGVSNVNVKVDGTEVSPDSTGKWTFNGEANDGTYSHQIVITDKAGNSVTKKVSVIRDTKEPELSVSNDTNDNDALNFSKVITEKNTNYSYSESDGKHYYLLSGKWSDTTAGTYKLQYRVSPKHDSGTYSDEWSEWRDVPEVTQSTAESSWSIKVPMTEGYGIGSGVGLQGRAIDAAGNKSEPSGHTGLKLDFSAPSFSNVSAVPSYVKKGETLTITGEFEDSFSIKEIKCVAKKGVTEVASGTSGYTFATEKVTEITVPGSNDYKLWRKGTFTITVVADDNNNGNWTFDLSVTDKADRTTSYTTLSTIVDTKKPEWNASSFRVNKKAYSTDSTDKNWYKSSALPFAGTLTKDESGIKEIKYSVIKAGDDDNPTYSESFATTKNDDGTESFSANIGEFVTKLTDGNAVANKVYMKAVDNAGNESDAQVFNIFIDSEAPAFTCAQSGTQVTNGTKNIEASGTFDDDASGVASVALEITYTEGTTKKTVSVSSSESLSATLDQSAKTWSYTIPADALTVDASYSVKATVSDNAGNTTSNSLFSIQKDTEKPVFKTPTVDKTSTKYKVYQSKDDNNTYFVNNTDGTFSISGVATDNFGIESVELKIEGKNSANSTVTIPADNDSETEKAKYKKTTGGYAFENLDLSGLVGEATATLTVTDKAGNNSETPFVITLKFDTTAPKGIHAIDGASKDIFFRMGENDNDEPATLTEDDKKVGGKYSIDTYGNDQTIRIRGTMNDTGSGVEMIFYKVVPMGSTEKEQTYLDGIADTFLKNYTTDTENTGYFKTSKEETKRVFYTPLTGDKVYDTDGESVELGGEDTIFKGFVSDDKASGDKREAKITSNFDNVFSGFDAGCNYLILVAVDNVGNVALDSVNVWEPNGQGVLAKTKYSNFSINVDTTPPDASLSEELEGILYANDKGTTTVYGTANDTEAGIRTLTVKVNGKEISATLTKTLTASNDYGTLTVTKNPDLKNVAWSVVLNNDKVFESASDKNYSVDIVLTDNAGKGNKNTVPVGSVLFDKTPPTVTLTLPTDAETDVKDDESTFGTQINGTITLEGTINDTNVLPGTAITDIEFNTTSATATTGWASLSTKGISLDFSGSYTFKAKNFDTTKLDNGTYYLRAVAKDSAGNIGYSTNEVKVVVDQDSDRPKVNFNNIDWNSTLGKFLLRHGTDAQVTGRITDDDSTSENVVTKFIVSETEYKGTGTEPANLLRESLSSSGDFTIYPEDASYGKDDEKDKTFYIYIKDNGGKEFYTTYTSVPATETTGTNDKLKNPKILVKNKSYAAWDEKQFVYKSDSKNPTPGVGKGVPYSDEAATDVAKDFSGNEFDTGSENSNLNASFIAGGTDRRYVKFYFTGRDASGIASMSATFTKTVEGVTTTLVTLSTPEGWTGTTDETSAEWTTGVVDTKTWGTIQVTVSVTITDRIGNATTSTYSFMVDNTPPDILVTKPVNASRETQSVTIAGTAFDEGAADTDTIKWAIPNKTQAVSSDSEITDDVLKNLKDTLTWNDYMKADKTVKNWEFVFDDSGVSEAEKSAKTTFAAGNPLLDIFDNNNYTTAVDGIYPLHIYFMAADRIGNYTILTDYVINHDPDGDRPQTTFSYPTKKDYAAGTAYATLGGTIRATGQSIIPYGDATAKEVYFQLVRESESFTDDTNTSYEAKKYVSDLTYTDSSNAQKKAYTVVTAQDILGSEYTAITALTGNDDATMTKKAELLRKYGFSSESDMTNWWGIKANGSASWNFSINEHGELNSSDINKTNDIKLRVCGVNSNNKFGAWSDGDNIIHIHVSSGVPQFEYKIAQFSGTPSLSSTPTVEQSYTADMYLKGQWYIVVTAKDDAQIDEITAMEGSSIVSGIVKEETGTDIKTIKMIVPMSAVSGEHSYTVSAKDNTNNTSKMTFSVIIDNTAPTLTNIKGPESTFSENAENTIENYNSFFTLSGESEDTESGVEYIAFYYMRKIGDTQTDTDRIILDPLIPNAKATNTEKDVYRNARVKMDGLTERTITQKVGTETKTYSLWAKMATGTMPANNQFTADAALGDHVRKGGLIEIGGVYKKITEISGTTVTFDGELTDKTQTSAYFPIAQIIDANNSQNTSESNKGDYVGKFKFDEKKDDGDDMPESFNKSGQIWSWDASIYSNNMPDGPVSLVVLAFDKAGNVNGKTYSAKVANNAPRLSKVHLGTDLNHGGTYSDNEFETYNIIAKTGANEKVFTLTTASYSEFAEDSAGKWQEIESTRKAFTVKRNLAVLPEFVGGNGEIKLVFNANDTTTAADGKQTGTAVSKTGTITTSNDDKHKIVGDYWQLSTELGTDATKQVSFTFWDSTEQTICGTDSLYAFLRVEDLVVAQSDSIAPNVVVYPFEWNQAGSGTYTDEAGDRHFKNNLYYASGSNSPLGHIELEGDLPADTFKATTTSGEYDRDPKVSGKIVLRGTAFDETLLKSLSFSMTDFDDGKNILLSEYANGVWTNKKTNAMNTNSYEVTVTDEYLNQTGHKVNWEIAIDTAHLKNTAELDAVFTVIAKDQATTTAHSSSDTENVTEGRSADGTTDATKHKPTYKMDVVPYITGIETLLTRNAGAEVARSANGYYSVYTGETITISGFNLKKGNTAPVLYIGDSTTTLTTTVADSSKTTVKAEVKSAAVSGGVKISVNDIVSLNNQNASPTFTDGATEADSNSSAMYNSMANTTNNKRLTDDVMLYVWKNGFFKQDVRINAPSMKMDSAGNYYMIYDNNTRLFDGSEVQAFQLVLTKNESSRSRRYIDGSYNKFHNTAIAIYNGNPYGVATNTDRVENNSARFKYYSWDGGNTNGYGTGAYAGTNTGYSLEMAYNAGTQRYDINRVPTPKMVADSRGNMYMSYFDANHSKNPVKFRYGNGLKQNADETYMLESNDNLNYQYSSTAPSFHVVADESMTYKGGKYSAVGVTSGGVAVVAWYDASARRLVYSYNTAPNTPVYGGAWQSNAQVIDDSYAGQYVDLFVDSNDGIHIAYYVNSSGDLKYAYLPSYNFELTDENRANHVVTVDAYLSAGTNITINTKEETVGSTTYIVPYIAYQNASFIQTTSPIRVAWLPKTIVKGTAGTDQNVPAGAVGNFFTENWEVVAVPTTNIPTESMVCSGVPTGISGGIGNGKSPVLAFMSDVGYESAFIKY